MRSLNIAYALNIPFAILLALTQSGDLRLAAAFLITVNIAWMLVSLRDRAWEHLDHVGVVLLVCTGVYVVLALGFGITLLVVVIGLLIAFASAVLLALSLMSPAESLFDRFHEGRPIVEEVEPTPYEPVFTTKGGATFHRKGCRILARISPEDRVELHADEARSYGLRPCKACK